MWQVWELLILVCSSHFANKWSTAHWGECLLYCSVSDVTSIWRSSSSQFERPFVQKTWADSRDWRWRCARLGFWEIISNDLNWQKKKKKEEVISSSSDVVCHSSLYLHIFFSFWLQKAFWEKPVLFYSLLFKTVMIVRHQPSLGIYATDR